MTPRISVNGELRVHGREVEIIVKPGWTDADLDIAASLAGGAVRFIIVPVSPLAERMAAEPVRTRLFEALAKAQGPRFWSGTARDMITDLMPEVMQLIEEARR